MMKILVAVDGSSCSDHAVEEVGLRPWPKGTEIKIINAFEMPLPATPEGWALPANYFKDLDAAVRQQSESIVKKAVTSLKKQIAENITVEGDCIPGSPRSVILDEAKSWNADLIVVGSHGYRAWERFLLGSVSQSVVSHAKCSVEVVRCAPVPAAEPVLVKQEVR